LNSDRSFPDHPAEGVERLEGDIGLASGGLTTKIRQLSVTWSNIKQHDYQTRWRTAASILNLIYFTLLQIEGAVFWPKRIKRWIYDGFAISIALNVTGLVGIDSGSVTWIEFFQYIVDVYAHYVREPVLFLINLIWPFGRLPSWLADLLVI